MDSLSQIVLGGAVAAVLTPASHRRAALLAGAALGTLPDLDGLPLLLQDDPILRMTLHRSLSHSLFVLPLIGTLIWWWYRRRGGLVAESPTQWFWAIQLALITHPLLDAFTVYGTQLWWPLHPPPTMWSSVFIIDPLYTLWLLVACLVAWWARERVIAQRALVAGLVLSTAYLGWSLVAKHLVEREADRALAAIGLQDAPRFSVPMPFNTLLWRVVAMTPDGYVEGLHSLAADRSPIRFVHRTSDVAALKAVADLPNARHLAWFNHGFMKAWERDGKLYLSDLRMGVEPDYIFNFAIAERTADGWRGIPAEQLRWPWRASRRLSNAWARIWDESVEALAPATPVGDAMPQPEPAAGGKQPASQ